VNSNSGSRQNWLLKMGMHCGGYCGIEQQRFNGLSVLANNIGEDEVGNKTRFWWIGSHWLKTSG